MPKKHMLFYEEHPDKLENLIESQVIDRWSWDDIGQYFTALGYDLFFINSKIKPLFESFTKD